MVVQIRPSRARPHLGIGTCTDARLGTDPRFSRDSANEGRLDDRVGGSVKGEDLGPLSG
jgi:hypothetical protein